MVQYEKDGRILVNGVMNGVRVIAGTERGRKLTCPRGQRVRPTSDRVREALFNILQSKVPGALVLDLFAGTGALGIEALSRGARQVVFVDNHPGSLATIRANLDSCNLSGRACVVKDEAVRFLRQKAAARGPFDLIFADPPYHWDRLPALLSELSPAVLVLSGYLVLEHARGDSPPERYKDLVRVRFESYGDSEITFYGWTQRVRN